MNKLVKQNIIKLFFFMEVITILIVYLFGTQGLPVLLHLKKDNKLLEQEINGLQHEANELETTLKEWQEYSFYKEKIAREQLQMACEDELIYYFSTQKS